MKVVNKPIKDLIPYEFNNKIHDERQIDRIANSIKEFGFLQPVVIDKNNVLIVGHGRVEGAKKLGMEEVPCVLVDNLTEAQIKKYRILDNKLNESEWDYKNLKVELEDLGNLYVGALTLEVGDIFPELDEGDESFEEGNENNFTPHESGQITIQVIAENEEEAEQIKEALDELGFTYK